MEGMSAGKGYVDMSTVDEATSLEIAAAVTAKGGRFLEVRLTQAVLIVGDLPGGWGGVRGWRHHPGPLLCLEKLIVLSAAGC